jgi:DNA-binding PadR family transcriptional regulator
VRPAEPLGQVEFSVLDAVHRGALHSRRTARQIHSLRERPVGEVLLHDALRWCERAGLLSSTRDGAGRLYRLTAAGRARLRADRRWRVAMMRLLVRRSAVCAISELPSTGRKRP